MTNLPRPMLIDPCNRQLNYLRISITDRCNLSCIYCLPPESIPRLPHEEILRYEEILRLVRLAVRLGVTKVRVTGGEPLVRKGVYAFLSDLASLPGLRDISITTNGVLLKDNLHRLREAGISRINVSLDTLKPERYHRITGSDSCERVWQGVRMAESLGFNPIKLNVVALRGVNEDELVDLARLSLDHAFHVRFIEYMPIGRSRLHGTQPLLLAPEIKKRLKTLGKLIALERSENDGPAQRYRFEGARGEVGFIPAISHHFCDRCNRLRLTASGQLRPCLLSDHQEDLKHPLRSGASDMELAKIFYQAIRHKPSDHNLADDAQSHVYCQMRSIGG